MAKKVLTKKLILTADFKGLDLEGRLEKETNMAKAQADNPNIVPGLSPAAAAVQTSIVAITDPHTGLLHQRAAAKALEESLTVQINNAEKAIRTIIVSEWMPETQSAITGNINAESYAATLQFGIKGQTTGHTPITVAELAKSVASAPVIVRIDFSVHGQHIVHVHNNITGKIGHPTDVERIDIYGQTGGAAPTNLAALITNGGGWLGSCKRGKFINQFTVSATNIGKVEYYIAVYIEKATMKPGAQSLPESATIE